MKPMLAVDYGKLKHLHYPVYVSPKLDGIRTVIEGGAALTRSLKELPNRATYARLSRPELTGLDGECIVGDPTAHTAYRSTVSGVMTHAGDGGATFWVFDDFTRPELPFHERLAHARARVEALGCDDVRFLEHFTVDTPDQLLEAEDTVLGYGYEGLVLRQPHAPYKYGRSTPNEQGMVKKKRFVDSEAEILEVIEQLHNNNVATTNELGYTERSSHQENMVGMGILGALRVRDIHSGLVFNVGTGFINNEREFLWRIRSTLPGKIIKYKYFPIGVKDLPRHPVYLGFRARGDM